MEKDKFTFLVSNIFHNFESIKGYHSENLFIKNLRLNSNDFLETDYKYEKYKEKTTNQFSLIETTSYYFIFFLISILLIKNININSLGTFILLENLIHPCGFYKNKAKNIKSTATILLNNYNSISSRRYV